MVYFDFLKIINSWIIILCGIKEPGEQLHAIVAVLFLYFKTIGTKPLNPIVLSHGNDTMLTRWPKPLELKPNSSIPVIIHWLETTSGAEWLVYFHLNAGISF